MMAMFFAASIQNQELCGSTLFGPTNNWICSFREDKFSANQNQEMPWQQEQDKKERFW